MKLFKKKGGKPDFKYKCRKDIKAAVIVCSDTRSTGQKEDKAGKAIIAKLESAQVEIVDYLIIPDEFDRIQEVTLNHVSQGTDLIIFTGGTGLSKRDVTPDALAPLLDREIPGIAEAIRSYGQERTPYSMLSRSIVGTKEQSVIMALPGSTKGASESMDAVFPALLHVFQIFKGARHD